MSRLRSAPRARPSRAFAGRPAHARVGESAVTRSGCFRLEMFQLWSRRSNSSSKSRGRCECNTALRGGGQIAELFDARAGPAWSPVRATAVAGRASRRYAPSSAETRTAAFSRARRTRTRGGTRSRWTAALSESGAARSTGPRKPTAGDDVAHDPSRLLALRQAMNERQRHLPSRRSAPIGFPAPGVARESSSSSTSWNAMPRLNRTRERLGCSSLTFPSMPPICAQPPKR